jgi:gliding motility-associated-like protein
MIQKIFLSTILLIFSKVVIGQSFFSRWQYSWGGDRQDLLNVMIPLPSNKYFFAGTTASNISCTKSSVLYGDEDFAVMVFDDIGNKLWEKSYGGDNWDQLKSAIKIQSGGFILAGETQSGISGLKTSPNNGVSDFWVVKIDDNGNLLWEKSYGREDFESAVKILTTPDGGFLIAGLSLSNIPGYNYGSGDYQLMKIDTNGNLLWSNLYGGTDNDELYSLEATTDGNYFLCGMSKSAVSGNKTSSPIGQEDIWLVKVDTNGNKLWDKCFGTTSVDFRGRLLSLKDGNTLIIESSNNTGRIRKIDNSGNQIWLKSCSGNNQDFFEVATEDTLTGNIYVAGTSKTDNVGCKASPYNGGGWFSDIWIAVFDSFGNKINDLDYGGNDVDIPNDIKFLNNEIWITGWSDSPLSGNKTTNNCGQTADGWIIRLSNKFYINANTASAFCQSQQNSKVHFTTIADFNLGNIFTVQLSDINGNFSSPQNIGFKLANRSDSILISLPANIPNSSNYKVRVIASSPSDTTASYPFWIHGLPQLNLGNDTILCTGNNIILNTGQQPPNTRYLWQNNSTNNFFSVNSAGLYWCEIQNSCGTVRDSIIVSSKQSPMFTIGNDSSFCDETNIILQSSVQAQDYSYLWNTGSISPSISVTSDGLYWLKVTNVCGSNTDSMKARLYNLPSINLNKDSVICKGLARVLSAGNGFTNYQWSTGESTPSISINTTGLYWIKVTDNHSCIKSDTVIITKTVNPPKDFIPQSDSICASYGQLKISSSNTFSNYLWNNGINSNSIVISYPGTYWLTVTDKYFCKATDTIIVHLKKCLEGFYIPTAFTPNQDGINDAFKPIVGGNLKNYRFTIYSRLGNIVFTTTDPKNSWDGRFNNALFNSGVFIWTCEFELEGYKSDFKKGTVILIR